jgi:hypothetical protein
MSMSIDLYYILFPRLALYISTPKDHFIFHSRFERLTIFYVT